MLYLFLILSCVGLLTWSLILRTRLAEAKIQNTNLLAQIDGRQTIRSSELDDEFTYLHNRRSWREQPAARLMGISGLGAELIQ